MHDIFFQFQDFHNSYEQSLANKSYIPFHKDLDSVRRFIEVRKNEQISYCILLKKTIYQSQLIIHVRNLFDNLLYFLNINNSDI